MFQVDRERVALRYALPLLFVAGATFHPISFEDMESAERFLPQEHLQNQVKNSDTILIGCYRIDVEEWVSG